jgi:pyridoxine kinase
MARVLCMSSQTVFGPVGNSAAVPALQASGHEVLQIPTVILSNHPGLAKPVGQLTSVDLLEEMFVALDRVGAFQTLDAVMTGYFASRAQVIAVAKRIATLKSLNQQLIVLIDPVIGDHGALYVAREVAEAMRDHLLPLATITTPNLFELQWLAETNDISSAVQALGVAETIVTSIPEDASMLRTELHHRNMMTVETHIMPKYEGVPNGTGDYLAGCFLAERLRYPAEQAFSNAMQRVETAISKSLGSSGLKLS